MGIILIRISSVKHKHRVLFICAMDTCRCHNLARLVVMQYSQNTHWRMGATVFVVGHVCIESRCGAT